MTDAEMKEILEKLRPISKPIEEDDEFMKDLEEALRQLEQEKESG